MGRKRPRVPRSLAKQRNLALNKEPSVLLAATATTDLPLFTNDCDGNQIPSPYKVDPAFVECALWDNNGRLFQTALVDTGANFSSVSRELAKQIYRGESQNIILHNGARNTIDR